MSKNEKKQSAVLSARIDYEIHESFETVCERLKIKKSVVLQELVKDFVVRNANKESHENAEILPPKLKEFDD